MRGLTVRDAINPLDRFLRSSPVDDEGPWCVSDERDPFPLFRRGGIAGGVAGDILPSFLIPSRDDKLDCRPEELIEVTDCLLILVILFRRLFRVVELA